MDKSEKREALAAINAEIRDLESIIIAGEREGDHCYDERELRNVLIDERRTVMNDKLDEEIDND